MFNKSTCQAPFCRSILPCQSRCLDSGGAACAALVGAQNPFEPAARVPAAFEPVSRVPAVLPLGYSDSKVVLLCRPAVEQLAQRVRKESRPSKIVRTISPAQQWQPAAFACPGCGNVPLADAWRYSVRETMQLA